VGAARDYRGMLAALDRPLPEGPSDPLEVVEQLVRDAGDGLVAMGSGRYFGFVVGGALPSSTAVDWLASAWDQNTGLAEVTPAVSALEAIAGRWVLELLGLPARSSFAFVTGCQMAHVTCLAAARHGVYRRAGWDLPEHGLAGAPPLRVVVGDKRHVTVTRALRLLGIGREQEVTLPVDREGRMDVSQLPDALEPSVPTIVCVQAGEVNTGAFDDIEAAIEAASGTDAWVHVDGAFGLWAATVPSLRHLLAGYERADSWATDAHKWLNVRTTAASRSARTRPTTRPRWSTPRPTSTSRSTRRSATPWDTARSSRGAPAPRRSGLLSGSSAAPGSPTSSSERAPTHAASRNGSPGSRAARC
jgi:glutamate/tyrosine decarboxylase-like PLP-dependent enzyme